MSVREHRSKATSQEHGVEPEVSRDDPRFKYFLLNVTAKVVQAFSGGESRTQDRFKDLQDYKH